MIKLFGLEGGNCRSTSTHGKIKKIRMMMTYLTPKFTLTHQIFLIPPRLVIHLPALDMQIPLVHRFQDLHLPS